LKFNSKAELTKWALESTNLWLFLDYDGTLADFASTPDRIEPNPMIIGLLKQLSAKAKMRVTVLSGRRLEHIRHLLPVEGIMLAGTYGIELLAPTGEIIHRLEYDEIRPVLETIKPEWESIIDGRKDFYLEDKGWTLALHARYAADAEAEQVIAGARSALNERSLARSFRVLEGHKFLEIAPLLASKREAVSYLLALYPLSNARLLYIGDDDKDEEALPVIHDHQGAAVKVYQSSQAGRPTQADFFFRSPSETRQWLERLI